MAEVRVAGETIRYTEAGPVEAPAIVFVHGALVDGRLWTATADDLARRGHRVIVPGLAAARTASPSTTPPTSALAASPGSSARCWRSSTSTA